VRAAQNGVDPPAPLEDLVKHPPMNVLQGGCRCAAPTDHRLVRHDKDRHLETRERSKGIERTRQPAKFTPRLYVVVAILVEDAIPI